MERNTLKRQTILRLFWGVRTIINISCLFVLLSYCLPCKLWSQSSFDYPQIIQKLDSQLQLGNRRALRELGTLLDLPEHRQQVIHTLEKNTFFQTSEVVFQQVSRADFLLFFYNNENKIKFSEVLKGFYLTPIEAQQAETQNIQLQPLGDTLQLEANRQLRQIAQQWGATIGTNDTNRCAQLLRQAAELQTKEAYHWLLSIIQNRHIERNKHALYQHILQIVVDFPTQETLDILLHAYDEGIFTEKELLPSLSIIVNQPVHHLEALRLSLDSLDNNLAAMRRIGYEKGLTFKSNFFEDRIDFLGKILSTKNIPNYLKRNALADLLASENIRALFYIAAQVRLQPQLKNFYIKKIEKLTKMRFHALPTEGGEIAWAKDYVRFWVARGEDFEWDKARHQFVSKTDIANRTQYYEQCFRRLNSENDSAAFGAFIALTEGEPSEVENLADRYRTLLRAVNLHLPEFRHQFLEQMAHLVRFCQNYHISYQLSKENQLLVRKLLQPLSPQERFAVENNLLKIIDLQDVTAFEYAAFLHAQNIDASFSFGRIFDKFYSEKWLAIEKDTLQLRLFLKKTALFRKIGTVGVCNLYHKKINLNSQALVKKFQFLAQTEDDTDIITEIQILLAEIEEKKREQNSNTEGSPVVRNLVNAPQMFLDADLRAMPMPTENDVRLVVNALQLERDKENIQTLLKYLELHPTIEGVPHLFRILGDGRSVNRGVEGNIITVGERIADILQVIYRHRPKTDNRVEAWRERRDRDGANFRLWQRQFLMEQIDYLKKAIREKRPLNIEDLNEVASSPLFKSEQHRALILQALPLVRTVPTLRALQLKPRLVASRDLAVFENQYIAPKDLDDLFKSIEPDDFQKVMLFAAKQLDSFRTRFGDDTIRLVVEKGAYINSMFKIHWFADSVREGKLTTAQREDMINAINKYLASGETISEYEEQGSLMNLTELGNVGQTTANKLRTTFTIEILEEAKSKIQEAILARVRYQDLPEVIRLSDSLSRREGYEPLRFLSRDFGLPIFNLDAEQKNIFIKQHQQLTQKEIYTFYLKKFDIDFIDDNNQLDLDKIYNILKYEIVAPFAGNGGERRDWFAYGVIKLLELTFNTQLHFHEKLNENQLFYTYNAAKRANAWMAFLEERKLVNSPPSVPASFNRLLTGLTN